MASQPNLKRPQNDYGAHYRPLTGLSDHPRDLDYLRRNIPCQWACPALTDIPGYIKAVFDQDYATAYTINHQANLFPGVLGRVCSRPCETSCRHGEADLGEAVSICHLKRVAADYGQPDVQVATPLFAPSGKTVAIVGGGPAGLAAAHSLALLGHLVTIYEAKPQLGGMLLYGIPDFRVSPALVAQEISQIIRLGVRVSHNVRLGTDIALDDLRTRHDAVIIALGCYHQNRLKIPGEELANVYSGLEFMIRFNEQKPLPVGEKVAVIGGGFTAMDCSRAALRLGAGQVVNYIRRTEEELAVTREEVLEAKKEGVLIASLATPLRLMGTTKVSRLEFTRNRLVAAGTGAVKKPVPIKDSEFSRAADTVIVAIGQGPDLKAAWPEGLPEFDRSGASPEPGLYLAGDCLNGASTVIEAIGHAQRVAALCDQQLMNRRRRQWLVSCQLAEDTSRQRTWDFLPKTAMPTLAVAERLGRLEAEVETGFEVEQAKAEASRCYLCNLRYQIHVPACIYCRWCIDLCPRDCIHLVETILRPANSGEEQLVKTSKWNKTAAIVIDSERCIRCGECLRICPTQCIHVTRIGFENTILNESGSDDNS